MADLALIEWEDSRQPSSAGKHLDDHPVWDSDKCASVGWLAHDDKQKKCSRRIWGHRRREQHATIKRDCYPDFLCSVSQATDRSYLPFFCEGRCVKTDAATVLTPFGVEGLLSNLLAIDATRADVCSFGGNLRVAI